MSRVLSIAGLAFATGVLVDATLGAPPRFVESRLTFESEIRSYEVEDVDADKLRDLLVVTREKAGRRLALHRQRPDGSFAAEPDWAQSMPAEVVAFALLDCRPEPGREILLLTPGGVLSASFTKPGLAGNARVEIRQPVYPEIAEANELPLWPWVLDLDGDGRDELVLPEVGSLGVFVTVTAADGSVRLERRGSIPSRFSTDERPDLPRQIEDDDDEDEKDDFDRRAMRLFQGESSTLPRSTRPMLLDKRRRWELPRLGYWNSDLRPDAVVVEKDSLSVQLQLEDGTFGTPTRIEIPAVPKDKDRSIELVNFEPGDSDPRSELVRITQDDSGTEKDYEIVVSPIGKDGLPATDARAVLLLRASDADFAFRDADGDGWKDLVVTTTQLPSGIASLAALKVEVALEVYRGHADGSLSKRPDARFNRTFTPEKLGRLAEASIFHLSGDYDGDHLDDLLLMDDEGRMRIHRLVGSGGELKFADEPLLPPYAPPEPVLSCWAFDFSPDDVSDLCMRFEKSLVVFVSRKEAGQ